MSRGTGLGRRRPKLKKCRVPNTQIGFHPETFRPEGPQKSKTTEPQRGEKKKEPLAKFCV
jgi:hypothetical protein